MTYEALVEQQVLLNPLLSRGTPRRATREEEAEMLRWAIHPAWTRSTQTRTRFLYSTW